MRLRRGQKSVNGMRGKRSKEAKGVGDSEDGERDVGDWEGGREGRVRKTG